VHEVVYLNAVYASKNQTLLAILNALRKPIFSSSKHLFSNNNLSQQHLHCANVLTWENRITLLLVVLSYLFLDSIPHCSTAHPNIPAPAVASFLLY